MPRRFALISLIAVSLGTSACRKNVGQQPDNPRLSPGTTLRDVVFRSAALDRDMPYRVILPTATADQKLQVVYLLHGRGGRYQDWSNYSDVSRYAVPGILLVMPEGNSSYYVNAVDPPQDRYEDYIAHDLIADVESRFPVAPGRSNRAIIGVSMGGFGAVNLAFHHPDLFAFVGGVSSAVDVPRRAFSIRRLAQSRHFEAIFGAHGSQTRRNSDPLLLARTVKPDSMPYFFLTCGEQEGLLPSNREFAALLTDLGFKHQFHTVSGGHDWNQWNAWLPELFRSLKENLAPRR